MTKTQDELKAAAERLGAWARLIEGAPKDGETFEVAEDVALDLASDLRLILSALRSPDPEVERLRGALDLIGPKARQWAGFYPDGADGRNTFVMFAEWAESVRDHALSSNSGGR